MSIVPTTPIPYADPDVRRRHRRREDEAHQAHLDSPEGQREQAEWRRENERRQERMKHDQIHGPDVVQYVVAEAAATVECSTDGCHRLVHAGTPALVTMPKAKDPGETRCAGHVGDEIRARRSWVWFDGFTALSSELQAKTVDELTVRRCVSATDELFSLELVQESVARWTDPRPSCSSCQRRTSIEQAGRAERVCGWCQIDQHRKAESKKSTGPIRARWENLLGIGS